MKFYETDGVIKQIYLRCVGYWTERTIPAFIVYWGPVTNNVVVFLFSYKPNEVCTRFYDSAALLPKERLCRSVVVQPSVHYISFK